MTATAGHADFVAANLREADRKESAAFTGGKPVQTVLRESVNASDIALVVLYDGRPVILCGVAPHGGCGSVWLRATREIHKVSRWFLRNAESILKELHAPYDGAGLFAIASEENSTHIRWLDAIGFSIDKDFCIRQGDTNFIIAYWNEDV